MALTQSNFNYNQAGYGRGEWLTTAEAAKIAKVTRRTIYTWFAHGLRRSNVNARTTRIHSSWLYEYITLREVGREDVCNQANDIVGDMTSCD